MVVASGTLVAQDIALRIAKLGYGIAGIMQSADEALDKIDLLMPDLILIHIVPADSRECIDALQQIQLIANIPVILYSDYPEHALNARALSSIAFTYLQLPLHERELELKLELVLLRHRIEEQTRLTRLTLERRILDITKELDSTHQALQELQKQRHRDQASLRRFSEALDDSADSIYLIDRISMLFIDVNKTACERSGYKRDELLEMSPQDIMPYLNKLTLAQEFDKIAARSDRFGIIDTWHQAKNSEIYPVEVRLRAIEAEEGPIIVAIARDMTLKRKNEEALRLSEEKFRLLFEIAPIGLGFLTADYRINDANPAYCKMLGYSREELIGKSMYNFTHPDDKQSSQKNVANLFDETATNFSMEKKFLHKGGNSFWVRFHGTVLHGRNRQPLYGMGIIENIDHIKQAEALRVAQETAQKQALIREVHHRIKNHLQGVVGLMQQHALSNSQGNNIIELAISQINAVATIHGLQGKESGEDIDLLQMLTAISNSLRITYPMQIATTIKQTGNGSTKLHREESVPIALALNEIMVNAAKHGFGTMKISLDCSAHYAIICIENQYSQMIENLTPGSGLELVQALVQTKGAAFEYEHANQRFLAKIVLAPPVIGVYREA